MTVVKEIYEINQDNQPLELEVFLSKVSAGFPSPAEDFIEKKLDLNEYLITHPASTFLVRVEGYSMIGAGILDNDILVVDRSMTAANGKIVVAVINGELTVKRFYNKDKVVKLIPENPNYKPYTVKEGEDLRIWGVVTAVVRKF